MPNKRGGKNVGPLVYGQPPYFAAGATPLIPCKTGDTLIIPPPPSGQKRSLRCLQPIGTSVVRVLNRSGNPIGVEWYWVDDKSNEIQLLAHTIPNNRHYSAHMSQISIRPIMLPTDGGIKVRITTQGVTAGVWAQGRFTDISNKGVVYNRYDLSVQEQAVGFPREGVALVSDSHAGIPDFNNYTDMRCIPSGQVMLYNPDDIDHNVEVYLDDGINKVLLDRSYITAGSLYSSGYDLTGSYSVFVEGITLLPGMSLKMKLLEAISTKIPRAYMFWQELNLSPGSPEGDGAF